MKLAFSGRIAAVTAAPATALSALAALPVTAAQAAPAGSRVWYNPGGDMFTPSTIWRFDSATGTGFQRSFLPSRTAWPVQQQHTFGYQRSGATYALSFYPLGGTGRVTGLRYSSSTDIWVVNYDGYLQTWYGCGAAGLPAYARAAC